MLTQCYNGKNPIILYTMDEKFQVKTLTAVLNPQCVVYAAMHQDYSEGMVYEDRIGLGKQELLISEKECGQRILKHLLKGGRGHFGPFEHPQIVLSAGYFPHSVVQQLRTHRVGFSFDVQSMRYTGQRVCEVARNERDVEDVFYLRPAGEYKDRQGKKYNYDQAHRDDDRAWCINAAMRYNRALNSGMSEEHARGMLPFDYRQHFVMSCNARSLMHVLDLRAKADAQLEVQQFCELLMEEFKEWMPEIASWYIDKRWGKALLSP